MEAQTTEEKAYILVSNRTIQEGTILRRAGGLVLFRFDSGGAIQIPERRIYKTWAEAHNAVKNKLANIPAKRLQRKFGTYQGNLWIPL